MDSIYTGAWLTIVSLSGTSMDAGIPRVTEMEIIQSAQMRCSFEGTDLVSTGMTLGQQLGLSRWTTRAWTFQEAVLSVRCLYVTEEQAYFQCNGAPASTESIDDFDSPFHALGYSSPPIIGDSSFSYIHFRNPFLGDGAQDFFPWDAEWIDGSDEYKRLLCEYSQRRMTHDTDSVNAFGGILLQLERRHYREGFFRGGPIQDLNKCLAWGHSGPSRRRADFPAWSWAGWEGELEEVHVDVRSLRGRLTEDYRNWQKPYMKASVSVEGKLKPIFCSEPAECAEKAYHYGVGPAGTYSFDRADLPYDPFWDLARTSLDGVEFSEELLREGDRKGFLFIDCLTLKLDVRANQVGTVNISGVDCDMRWYGQDAKDIVKKVPGTHDFIVLTRPTSGDLDVLMVDIVGQTATRIAAANLCIPDKGVLDKIAASGHANASSRHFAHMSAVMDGLMDKLGNIFGEDGVENMANDEFHGRMIAEGTSPQRRRMVLI